jgi:hypothetical protein
MLVIIDSLTMSDGQDKFYLDIYNYVPVEETFIDLVLGYSTLSNPEYINFRPTCFVIFPVSDQNNLYDFFLVNTLEGDNEFRVQFCNFTKQLDGDMLLVQNGDCLFKLISNTNS